MRITEGWKVVLVGGCFFAAPVFTALFVCFSGTGQYAYEPNRAQILAALCGGLANGCTAVLAFFNKSLGDYERNGGVKP